MPERDRICLECGHTYAWHTRERARRMLDMDPGVERACYRRVGLQPCPCPEFRASNDRVATALPFAGSVFRTGVLTLLLVVMGLALLYAYRSQTPAIQTVPISQAVQDVQTGRVRTVTITGSRGTLELRDGTKEQTQLPDNVRDDPLQQAVVAYNSANPTTQIVLKYEEQSATFNVIGSVLLSLLPVLLIGGFFYYMMRTVRRRDD